MVVGSMVRVFVFAVALWMAVAVHAEDALRVTDWLKRANAALTSYDYAAALESFDHAIAMDPSSPLTYFRRATAQQALGRTGAALADLEETTAKNPSFVKAYLQQARIHMKEGNLAEAREVLKQLRKHRTKGDDTGTDQEKELVAHVQQGLDKSRRLEQLDRKRRPNECVQLADELLKLAPNMLTARRYRADCEVAQGNLESAMSDWNRLAHLVPSPEMQLQLSLLSYYLLGTRESQTQDAGLAHLKACLHNDPDNKRCIRAHKQLRRIDKALQKARKFADSESWSAVTSALKGAKVGGPSIQDEVVAVLSAAQKSDDGHPPLLPASVQSPLAQSQLLREIQQLQCQALVEQNLLKKAAAYCEPLLAADPDNVAALVAVGENHLANERYDDAVRVLSDAFEKTQRSDRKVHQRLVRAQKRLKQAKSKDYYKTLDVARDADERTIKKAYRRLAREHHPDKGGSQEKMADINEAFGVLGDAELRARYDQGDDPNDPTGGQEPTAYDQSGHPFAQFFQQAAFQQQYGGGQFGGGQPFHFSF
ncbi:hypothetical protein MSPP1_003061 [Malassezia sp. CBS 17886]|nr:hypothetical protein MSPP1_003061 [Malassezia sp. CBS 17886]